MSCLRANVLGLIGAAAGMNVGALAQCDPRWLPADGVPGTDGDVYASAVWDPDGPGPAEPVLVVGGHFRVAGTVVCPNVAAWDGQAWHGLGEGVDGWVRAVAVYRGDLYAAGYIKTSTLPVGNELTAAFVVRWDGSEWQSIGGAWTGGWSRVNALTVFDDRLILGGELWNPDGTYAPGVQAWDGASWSATGLGGAVYALATYDGLLVAGVDSSPGVRAWDGSAWSTLGGGLGGRVRALAVHGGQLIAGGDFTTAGGAPASRIAAWDGSSWRALGSGTDASVCSLAGHGDMLFAGGTFLTAGGGGACHVAGWDGTAWSALCDGKEKNVNTFAEYRGDLYVGANIGTCGFVAHAVSRWDGSAWHTLGTGFDANVTAMTVCNGTLIAGGDFASAGDVGAAYIARWDGAAWRALGAGTNNRVFDVGTFRGEVIAAGNFLVAGDPGGEWSPYIAAWDGAAWHGLGGDSTRRPPPCASTTTGSSSRARSRPRAGRRSSGWRAGTARRGRRWGRSPGTSRAWP